MDWLPESPWLALFAELLIKSSLALAPAFLLVILSRRKTAGFRHAVLSLILIGLLFLPLIASLPIGWETRLWPSAASAPRAGRAAMVFRSAGNGASGLEAGALPADQDSALNRGGAPGSMGFLIEAGLRLESILPAVWAAGILVLLWKLGAGLLRASRWTREGAAVNDPLWRMLLKRFLAAVRLKKSVRLRSHPDVSVPLTWGFVKPVVLLPADHGDWAEDLRSSALVHELSHIKRQDFLVMMLVRLSLAVFWFNPLAWAVFRRMKREQEKACDEAVIRAGIKPSAYAANLLLFKRPPGTARGASTALLGMSGASSLQERVAAVLRQKLVFKEVRMKTKIMLSIAVMLAVTFIGLARPTSAASDAPRAQRAAVAPAADAPAAVSPAAPPSEARQVQNAEQRSQQESAKTPEKKEEKKHFFIIQNKDGKAVPIEITVGEGDARKTIMAEIPLTFQKDSDGAVILTFSGGKELRFDKGESLRLEIKGDKLEIVKEGTVYKIDKDGDRPDTIHIKTVKKDGSHILGWTIKEYDDKFAQKLEEARALLKKAREDKGSGQDGAKTLEEIEAKLKEMEELSQGGLKGAEEPASFVIVEKKKDGPDIGKYITLRKTAEKGMVILSSDSKDGFTLTYRSGSEAITREIYERIVERIGKSLPEGFSIEPEFNAESGRVILKIKEPTGKDMPRDLIKKLVDDILEDKKADAKK